MTDSDRRALLPAGHTRRAWGSALASALASAGLVLGVSAAPGVLVMLTPAVAHAATDTDRDGLDDEQEIAMGTNPNSADTDKDTLPDGKELSEYGTDPKKYDTDGDVTNDGLEIGQGVRADGSLVRNPLVPDAAPPPPPIVEAPPPVKCPAGGPKTEVPAGEKCPPPTNAVKVTFNRGFGTWTVNVKNNAGIGGSCTYSATSQVGLPGRNEAFDIAPNGSHSFDVLAPVGKYNVVTSCTGEYDGAQVEFGRDVQTVP